MVAHPKSLRAKKLKQQRKRDRSAGQAPTRPESGDAPQKERPVSARSLRKRRDRRRQALTGAGIFAAVVVLVWFAFRPGPELPGVERPPNDGRGHIAGATYQDETPTSGQHNRSAPACGLYPTPLAPDLAVHALEHGTVVYWYDASQPELAEGLTGLFDEFDSHVIVSPHENLSSPIIATAWNRRLALDEVGAEAVAFASTYRRRGPEQVRCDISS